MPWKIETIAKSKIQGVLQTDLIQVAGFVVEKQVLGTASILDNVKENGIDGSFGLGLHAMAFNGEERPFAFFFLEMWLARLICFFFSLSLSLSFP